jgi:hypothetical protein
MTTGVRNEIGNTDLLNWIIEPLWTVISPYCRGGTNDGTPAIQNNNRPIQDIFTYHIDYNHEKSDTDPEEVKEEMKAKVDSNCDVKAIWKKKITNIKAQMSMSPIFLVRRNEGLPRSNRDLSRKDGV